MSKQATEPQEMLTEQLMTASVGVLGSMLIDDAAVGPMLMAVSENDFHLPEHRKIFCAFRDLYGQGIRPDGILVNEKLGGGYDQLMVSMMERTLTAANADAYAEALKKSSRLWQLRQIGDTLANLDDEDHAQELLDKANLLFSDRPGIRRVSMQQGLKDFPARHGDQPTEFIQWGFRDLDELLHVRGGDFVVIGGRPSAGKTALAMQFAVTIGRKKRVGFFSYETDADTLFDRIVSCQTQTSFDRLMSNKLEKADHERIWEHRKYLTTPQVDLIEASGMSVPAISAYAMAHHYDVIMIDYLQKIPAMRSGRYMSDVERVSQVSDALQQVGRTTKKTVISLSQLARAEKRKDGSEPPPTMSSLRQSGQIEQDADVIMLLYNETQSYQNSRRCLDIVKNKNGIAGKGLLLNFDGDKQRFTKSMSQPVPQKPKPEPPAQQSVFSPVWSYEPSPFDKEHPPQETETE